MTNSLNGKRLLVLGGTSASLDLVKNAKKMGAYVIVTDNSEGGVAKAFADEVVAVSTADIDALTELVREKKVDGAFCGPSEFNLRNVIRLCAKAGLPCYTTEDVWDRCANKDVFKKYCREYGVDCTPEYDIHLDTPKEELEKIQYPIILKPVDGCSSAGISVCRSAEDVPAALEKAYAASASKKVIAEKFIENGGERFSIRYMLRDGEAYPYLTTDNYIVDAGAGNRMISGNSHIPSKYTDYYMKNMDANVRRMLKGMGLTNGTAFFQALPCDGKIYFMEMGYRLSGGFIFKLSAPLSNVHDMNMMIRYAAGGPIITDEEIAQIDIACKGRIGGLMMLPLDAGTIGRIDGVDEIKNHPAVLDFLEYYKVGDTVEERVLGTLGQHFGRIAFVVDSHEEELAAIKYFQDTLRIYDVSGNRMNNLQFDVNRFYQSQID